MLNTVKSTLGGKKILFLFLIVHCILNIDNCLSQSQFQLRIGGTNNDFANSIIRTTDGGYAAAGYTVSFGDMYIVKLDGSGALQWTRTIGGTNYDDALSIIQTTDGGYVAAGRTQSFGLYWDFYIVKLDSSGTLQWSKTIGGTGTDYAYSIIQTTDGGYVAGGSTNSFGADGDMYIVKLDGSGTLQWSRTIGGTGVDYAYSMIQTTDGGYAVAGWTISFGAGGTDMYIVKLDSSGTLQWSKTIGGTGSDEARSIIQTTDGGYAVAGISYAGTGDMYIIKLDGSGALQWTRTIGGTITEIAWSIIQTTDGGYVAAGSTYSFGAGNNDCYIVKLDGSGTLQWSKTIGGTGSDVAYSIIQTTDGGYVAAGSFSNGTGGDMYIVKFDSSWNTCGNTTTPSSISGSVGTLLSPTSIVNTPTPTVTSPTSLTNTGGTVTTICTLVGIQPISNETPNQFSLEQNYPNPFNPTTKIKFALPKSSFAKLVVYDALGRELETLVSEQLNAGAYEVDFGGANYASGVYYYKITGDDFSETKKAVLIK